MALLKFFLGNSSDLKNIPPIDGYLYFCTDDSNFYIDCYDPAQGVVVRKVVGGDQGEVDIDTSNLVTLDTTQTITGDKTFSTAIISPYGFKTNSYAMRTEYLLGEIDDYTSGWKVKLNIPKDYQDNAEETFATREWVENYIANNMPTYPAAEEASF